MFPDYIKAIAAHGGREDDRATMQSRLADLTQQKRMDAAALDFVRYASCLAITEGARHGAAELLYERWPNRLHYDPAITSAADIEKGFSAWHTKAAIAAGNTTDAQWASPLVARPLFADAFIALTRSASLIGRIPFRRVPFNLPVPAQTAAGTYYWVGEGGIKPVTKLAFAAMPPLPPLKGAGIIPITAELAKLSAPGTEPELQNALVNGIAGFIDGQMLDPAVSAVAGMNPASLTNTVAPVTSTGTIDGDLDVVLDALFTARPGAVPVLVLSPANASALAKTYRDASVSGGSAAGVSLVPSAAAEDMLIAIDPAGVLLAVADDSPTLDTSREASLALNDAPTGTATDVITSFWQSNLIGYKVEQVINYMPIGGAVQYVVTSAPAGARTTRTPGKAAR